MSACRLRAMAEAAARARLVFVACLLAGCQPAVPPAKPAPSTNAGTAHHAAAEAAKRQGTSPRVVVFAAASTQEPVEKIADEFRRSHPGVEVEAAFASSATLAKQIAEGAPADLFLSASPQWADFLAEREMVAQRQDLLGNALVVVVPADARLSIATPDDLLQGDVAHIALGDPDSVPAGIYAKQALSKLGLWDRLGDKRVAAEDVRHALALVETGAAEAGIVYATDAAVTKKVKLAFSFPSELSEPIVYPLARLKQGADNPAASEFYGYLQAPAAAALFRQAGFSVQPAAGGPQP